ncbi:MAG: hypothetical protein U5N56_00210 [Candidatus Marinimicrobia bacterium]|nr:hypothetical protein [Candidatus Neomarinimicrobiota bacterium]
MQNISVFTGMQTGSDVTVTINANIPGKKFLIIIDQVGAEIKFSSMIEALNYFSKYDVRA